MPADEHDCDLYAAFVEQPVQKVNDPKEPATIDSISFHKAPLFSTLTVLPTPSISNTRRDLGVHSPPDFSPTTLSNPINPSARTPLLFPSTSHMITSPMPQSQILTHKELFFHHITRKYQNKETKRKWLQPNHLEPESVLSTQTRQSYNL